MHMTQVLVFGDSIAWGAWDREGGGWVERLWKALAEKNVADPELHYRLYNLSISGDTTGWLLERFDSEAMQRMGFREDGERIVIIFAIGINDTKFLLDQGATMVAAQQFESNIEALIRRAKGHTSNIVLVGLTPVDKKTEKLTKPLGYVYRNEHIKRFDGIIKSICTKNRVHFIEIFGDFKAKGVEGLLEDGLHPNDAGHKLIFRAVKRVLEENGVI